MTLWIERTGTTRATSGGKWWDSEIGSCGYSHDGWRFYPDPDVISVWFGPWPTLEEAKFFAENSKPALDE